MKSTGCLLLALAFLIATLSLAAPTSVPTPPRLITDTIDRDKIALYDVGDLPFEKILKAQDQVWILAQITLRPPKAFSFDDFKRPGAQGAVTLPEGDGLPRAQGTLEVKSFLTGKGISTENYDFALPMFGAGPNTVVDHMIYSPFSMGGYAVCQVNPKAEGQDRYSPVYIVPAEWQAFVAPAFDFCRANPTLFSDTSTHITAARRTQLTSLLTSPNPYLAAFACRTLTKAGALDAGAVDMALLQKDPFRQAAMTYLLLANVPQQDNATATVVEGSIHAITNAANTLDSLHGLALGIGTALDGAGGPATWGTRDDLAEVRKRLAPDGAADSYVSAMLQGYERTDK